MINNKRKKKMEYIRTPEGKDIKVIISISEYKELQKKVKILDKLEKLNLSPEDLLDLALVRKTRGEDSIPLDDYVSKK